jgi:HSP20 family protein
MTLVRYNSVFPSLASSLFSDLLADFPVKAAFHPKVDVAENDQAYEVHVSLPGFKKEDIKIELDENRLTISGERKWENKEEDKNKKFHLVETEYGSFSRTFTLPNNVKQGGIEANFNDGILQLNIAKENKELKKQLISVN